MDHTQHTAPCAGWLLKTCPHGNYQWLPLKCHSWRCPICGPEKRAETIARLLHAYRQTKETNTPMKLVTLTYNRPVGRGFMIRSLQHLTQALRRRFGTFEYARFPEKTQKGRYHLHLVVLAPYIPQRVLSNLWRTASKGAYIVDIRAVRDAGHAANYITKYVTKGPAAKVTYSRRFPNFDDIENPAPPDPEALEFTYTWYNPQLALMISAAAPELWTSEPCYPQGVCTCFTRNTDHPPPRTALSHAPHPGTHPSLTHVAPGRS